MLDSIKMVDNTTTPVIEALKFLQENPSEKPTTAARIYKVSVNTLYSYIRRAKERAITPMKATRGGQNRILSKAQIEAIYKYVEDSYHAGYGASKSMVLMAIGHLRAAEIPPKAQPTPRWFQTFIKEHPALFRVIKMKAIARVRVTTHDIVTVEGWFME
jgi:hypothetical protein